MSLQWLIHGLEALEALEAPIKLIIVCAFIGLFAGPVLLYRRMWERKLLPLRRQIEETEEVRKKKREKIEELKITQSDKEIEIKSLEAQHLSFWLSNLEKERNNGNEDRGIRHLRKHFDSVAPGLADCYLELSRLEMDFGPDLAHADYLARAEKYAKLAALLDPSRPDA